jgi:hypothetical protein
VRIRLWHKGARIVFVLERRESAMSHHRWFSVHRSPPPWGEIFRKAFGLFDMPGVLVGPSSLRSEGGRGELDWTAGRYWTRIDLRLVQGSARKRTLLAAALLKAARYQV